MTVSNLLLGLLAMILTSLIGAALGTSLSLYPLESLLTISIMLFLGWLLYPFVASKLGR